MVYINLIEVWNMVQNLNASVAVLSTLYIHNQYIYPVCTHK